MIAWRMPSTVDDVNDDDDKQEDSATNAHSDANGQFFFVVAAVARLRPRGSLVPAGVLTAAGSMLR